MFAFTKRQTDLPFNAIFEKAHMQMHYPKRVYTADEVEKARALTERGWKHRLRVKGSERFRQKAKEAISAVKKAGFYDFLRTYVRDIVEIEGFSQLREAEVTIWINEEILSDPIDAASFFIQKAQQMKDFLEDKPYYGGSGEMSAINKRLEFLKSLKAKSKQESVRRRCEEILKSWRESAFL
jgi:hypothetical protein